MRRLVGCYKRALRVSHHDLTEYKLVSTFFGYCCSSISLHNISGGFNINLQAFQPILSLCTQTLFIVGYSTLKLGL